MAATTAHPFGVHGDYCTGKDNCPCDMCLPEADHDIPGEITWGRLDQATATILNDCACCEQYGQAHNRHPCSACGHCTS